jgi:hypothetical protein
MENLVTVEEEGNPECGHSWVQSNVVLTSYPPIHKQICEHCGRVESYSAKISFKPSFDEIYHKFHRV